MSDRLTITKYGQQFAVTLYKKGARAITAAITTLSTTHGKEVHHGIQAA